MDQDIESVWSGLGPDRSARRGVFSLGSRRAHHRGTHRGNADHSCADRTDGSRVK